MHSSWGSLVLYTVGRACNIGGVCTSESLGPGDSWTDSIGDENKAAVLKPLAAKK